MNQKVTTLPEGWTKEMLLELTREARDKLICEWFSSAESPMTSGELATLFGMSRQNISLILHRYGTV